MSTILEMLAVAVLTATRGGALITDPDAFPPDYPDPSPVLVAVKQAARMLGVSRSTLYELVRDGVLEAVTSAAAP